MSMNSTIREISNQIESLEHKEAKLLQSLAKTVNEHQQLAQMSSTSFFRTPQSNSMLAPQREPSKHSQAKQN